MDLQNNNYHCVTSDTEVLTPLGFKNYQNLNINDKIYTWKNGKLNINIVNKINIFNYIGKLHSYNGRGGLIINVTPNHRILFKTGKNSLKVKESSNIFNKFKTNIDIPISLINENNDFDISDNWLKLITFILTDGFIKKNNWGWCKSPTRWGEDEFKTICLNLGLTYTISQYVTEFNSIIHVYNFNILSSNQIKQYITTKKKLPNWMFKLSSRQANIILDFWGKTDGNNSDHFRLQADTNDVVNGLQHIALLANSGSRYTERLIGNNKTSTKYVIIYKNKFKTITSEVEINYNGIVWCPSTKDGIIIYRKNGIIFISGDSIFTH